MNVKRIITERDLEKAFEIRIAVFVEEQGVPLSEELDQYDTLDEQCQHILVYYDDKPVGTGRVRWVEDIGKLERICLLKDYREFGLGKVIVKGLEDITRKKGLTKVKLHGQTQAKGFYEKLGYQTTSDVFFEEGIPHVLMTKELTT
ncbi:GNAT family N-acetyltransferase [Bacillus sp. CLL-7-23]|uniref:GNAT family N-acetyltransferase n=1 Tax=Bacillus changyiensis TaxID=3004103 RepID=A0ABT4X8F6_9BACI|nr:GNAT family N-acetyltransferase [Bacillus changyiensis]MDA7028575.1 GNAT family N-acetyltransferase [Bacillus changyiensis]